MRPEAHRVMGTAEQPSRGAQKAHSIWAFLIVDSISFALLFLVFMVERLGQPELFDQSAQELNESLGLLNTVILITGSWLVALAVGAARKKDGIGVKKYLILAICVSSLFAILKVVEYSSKVNDGITPVTNDFFTFYYALTGFHLFHYLIGMATLVYLTRIAPQIAEGDKRAQSWLEAGALFWHMVDLLWIYIFSMLYLLGVQS